MGDQKSSLAFSQADADEIYDELRELHVDLDADPLAFGPKRLNKKVSQVRGMLDRCERIFLDMSQMLHRAKRNLRIASTTLELAKKNLFANDPETRAGRSVGDREAIATGKLKKDVAEVNHLELLVQDLDAVLLVVKAKRSDLRDTQGRLRDQIRLCQEEITLGGRWGSKSAKGAPDLDPAASAVDKSQNIDDLLGDVDGEIHLESQEGNWQDPEEFEFKTPEEDEEEGEEDGDAEEGSSPEEVEEEVSSPEDTADFDEESEESGSDDEPEEEPGEPESEDEAVDLEEALPATASAEAVDSFLDEPAPAPEPSKPKKDPKPDLKDKPRLDLEDILTNFETLD